MCFSLLEEMNYALIQYMFPDNIEQPLSPKKRKGKPFIPTAPSVKNFRKNQETVDNGQVQAQLNIPTSCRKL